VASDPGCSPCSFLSLSGLLSIRFLTTSPSPFLLSPTRHSSILQATPSSHYHPLRRSSSARLYRLLFYDTTSHLCFDPPSSSRLRPALTSRDSHVQLNRGSRYRASSSLGLRSCLVRRRTCHSRLFGSNLVWDSLHVSRLSPPPSVELVGNGHETDSSTFLQLILVRYGPTCE